MMSLTNTSIIAATVSAMESSKTPRALVRTISLTASSGDRTASTPGSSDMDPSQGFRAV